MDSTLIEKQNQIEKLGIFDNYFSRLKVGKMLNNLPGSF